MREIRENVRYRPARDGYKVFIIDEAHQITKEAFNALLKTLEVECPERFESNMCHRMLPNFGSRSYRGWQVVETPL